MKLLMAGLVALVLLVGCVDYKEKLNLKEDGTGTVVMDIIMSLENNAQPTTVEKIKEEFSAIEGITFKSADVKTKDKEQFIHIECGFANIDAFMKISTTQLGQTGIIGTMTFDKKDDGTFAYTRKVNITPGNEKYNWTFTTHLPGAIESSNADAANVKKGSGVVEWTYNIVKNTGEQNMEAVVKPGAGGMNPMILIIVGVGLVVIIGVVVAVVLLKKKKVPAAE